MKSCFRATLACLMTVALVAPASAIEFQGGILGKLFNGEGCSHCKKEEAPAPSLAPCECPAPEPAPAPETICECPAPEPAPEPEAVECCPCVTAPEPEAEPEPVSTPAPTACCGETIISVSEPVAVTAEPTVVEAAAVAETVATPVETIISESIIYEGPLLESNLPIEPAAAPVPVSAPAPAAAPAPKADIFGPAASWNVVAPRYRLVFVPKNGWSSNRPIAPKRRAASVKTVSLRKSSGLPMFTLSFSNSKASKVGR